MATTTPDPDVDRPTAEKRTADYEEMRTTVDTLGRRSPEIAVSSDWGDDF